MKAFICVWQAAHTSACMVCVWRHEESLVAICLHMATGIWPYVCCLMSGIWPCAGQAYVVDNALCRMKSEAASKSRGASLLQPTL